MVQQQPSCTVLFGIEPEQDCANGDRLASGEKGGIIALSPYLSESLRNGAEVVLPIGTYAETAGTFVSLEGRWQSFEAVASLIGAARPGWKVLRVLANRLGVPSMAYDSVTAVNAAARAAIGTVSLAQPRNSTVAFPAPSGGMPTLATLDVPMYRVDAVMRRAHSLQQTAVSLAAMDPAASDRIRA
jgi:NADH-quinone oxidoreductase subunit G